MHKINEEIIVESMKNLKKEINKLSKVQTGHGDPLILLLCP